MKAVLCENVPGGRSVRSGALCLLVSLAAALASPTVRAAPEDPVTVEDARAFLEDAEARLEEMSEYASRINWVQANFINYDTNWLATRANAELTELVVGLANEAARFDHLDLPPELERKMHRLKTALVLPAPSEPGAAQTLAELTTRLETTYATGEITLDGETVPLDQLEVLMQEVRDPAKLEEMWTKWREVAVPMREDYARTVEIGNAGARELGFANLADLWLSKYDMPPEEMRAEVERLWQQVEPLYEKLHCYVRAELSEHYGAAVQPPTGRIRADLLGNMWAQQWGNIHDLVAPAEGEVGYDLTRILREKEFTPLDIVQTGEAFFISLGFEPLPKTFWERSLITRPQDREVVCHASAWNLDDEDDVRIKMCTKVTADDFQTVHHELGHNFYQRAYKAQDPIYRDGAHDGFHEAIGDLISLSITPEYLVSIGLLGEDQVPPPEADVGLLLKQALDKIAFLPFALLIDKWRWQVFEGEVAPEDYNEAWWALRRDYQGLEPPVARPVEAFDPGAKYHIPAYTPYLRYFLSFVLQFQFHEAACELAGWEGPLHRCSIYGSEEAGEAFREMLAVGAAQPWQDTLEAFTGSRGMDPSALIEYFDSLIGWLDERNQGRQCGW